MLTSSAHPDRAIRAARLSPFPCQTHSCPALCPVRLVSVDVRPAPCPVRLASTDAWPRVLFLGLGHPLRMSTSELEKEMSSSVFASRCQVNRAPSQTTKDQKYSSFLKGYCLYRSEKAIFLNVIIPKSKAEEAMEEPRLWGLQWV